MKTVLRILLISLICTNTFGFLITLIPSDYGKICAKDLESPITYAYKNADTRAGYIILTSVLYSMYAGAYISLYLQEKPGRCN